MSTTNPTDPTTGLPLPNLYTTLDSPAVVPTSTNGYIDLGITVDPLQLIADAFGFIQAQAPGWTPAEGNLETWVIEACAYMVASLASVASLVPDTIFQYLGGNLLGVAPLTGSAAQVTTTWTMVDTQGYTVPAGTIYTLPTSGNTTVQFATTADFTVPAGQSSTVAGAVTMTAVVIGTAANGIAAGPMSPVTALSYVSSVTSTDTSSGGSAAETTGQYLNRLAQQLQLLSPRPILPTDFAVLATQVAGVARALAVNNFDPYNNQLTAPDGSFETGVGTWIPVPSTGNCTLATSTAQALDGTHSLAVTATATGTMSCESGLYPVSAATSYTALVSARAAATARSCTVGLAWYDISGNYLSTSTGTGANDSTTAWTGYTLTATSPSNAAQARIVATVTSPAASEIHYLDEAGLFLGTPAAWDGTGNMTSQERMVTVVPVDSNGDALDSTLMSTVATYLDGLREVNFVVNVVAPTYFAVNVSANVVAVYGADTTAVQSAVEAALNNMLLPANWAGGTEQPAVWLSDFTVRYLDVAAVINGVSGVKYTSSLTVNGGTADVTMTGFAPLPSPTLSVAVSSAPAGT